MLDSARRAIQAAQARNASRNLAKFVMSETFPRAKDPSSFRDSSSSTVETSVSTAAGSGQQKAFQVPSNATSDAIPTESDNPQAVIYSSGTTPFASIDGGFVQSRVDFYGNWAKSDLKISADGPTGILVPEHTISNEGKTGNAPCEGDGCLWVFYLSTQENVNYGPTCGAVVTASANHKAVFTGSTIPQLVWLGSWGATFSSDPQRSAQGEACPPLPTPEPPPESDDPNCQATTIDGDMPDGCDRAPAGSTVGVGNQTESMTPSTSAPGSHWVCYVTDWYDVWMDGSKHYTGTTVNYCVLEPLA